MQELLWAPQLDSHLEGSGMSRLKQSLVSAHPPVYTEGQSHEQRDITGHRVAQCKGRTRQTTELRPAVLHLLMRNLRQTGGARRQRTATPTRASSPCPGQSSAEAGSL